MEMETSKSRVGFAHALLAVVAVSGISAEAQADITKSAVRKIANQEITKRVASLVGPTLVGPAGADGADGADGQPGAMGPAGALFVHDVNGTLLGLLTGMHAEGFSLYNQDTGLLLRLNRTGDLEQSPTYHTAPDCTGTPYLPAESAFGSLFTGAPVRTGHNGDYQYVTADRKSPAVAIISTIRHPPRQQRPVRDCTALSSGSVVRPVGALGYRGNPRGSVGAAVHAAPRTPAYSSITARSTNMATLGRRPGFPAIR